MNSKLTHHTQLVRNEVCRRLLDDEIVKAALESIIWFGSVRNDQDVHMKSDCDLQIILDKPTYDVVVRMNKILEDYPDIDLSVMYLQDIFDHNGKVIFHDGTKGLFFIYVLAAGHILYGRNVYGEIIDQFTLEDLRPSLLVTVREYLSRLRIMAIQSPDDTLSFKKYSLKMFKDLMVYRGSVPYRDISKITNDAALADALATYRFRALSRTAIPHVTQYEEHFSREEMASLLCDYEVIIESVCNE